MLEISSSAFKANTEIPKKYTCEGSDVSPPLSWTGVPENTKSLVLIVDDPDAPDPNAPKMTWVHWLVYNLPPNCDGLAEAISASQLPEDVFQGVNDWKRIGYGGPCPPVGRHRYFFKLYALDTQLSEIKNASKTVIESAMQGHVIAHAELVATYAK